MDEDDQLRRPNAISDSRYDRPLKAKADAETLHNFNDPYESSEFTYDDEFDLSEPSAPGFDTVDFSSSSIACQQCLKNKVKAKVKIDDQVLLLCKSCTLALQKREKKKEKKFLKKFTKKKKTTNVVAPPAPTQPEACEKCLIRKVKAVVKLDDGTTKRLCKTCTTEVQQACELCKRRKVKAWVWIDGYQMRLCRTCTEQEQRRHNAVQEPEEETVPFEPADETTSLLGGKGKPGLSFQERRLRTHWVMFMYIITFVDIVMLIVAILKNGGIEPFTENPMLGPSKETLLSLGAKDVSKVYDGQIYRLFSASFLHSGIISTFVTVSVQLTLGRKLEQHFGWWRIALVYFLGVLFGNLFSCVMLPTRTSVGANGAIFALIGAAVAELIVMRGASSETPLKDILKYSLFILIALILGLLPFIDNFTNIGGLIAGVAAGLFTISITKHASVYRRFSGLAAGTCGLATIIVGLILLLMLVFANKNVDEWCEACAWINCIHVSNWCDETIVNNHSL